MVIQKVFSQRYQFCKKSAKQKSQVLFFNLSSPRTPWNHARACVKKRRAVIGSLLLMILSPNAAFMLHATHFRLIASGVQQAA